MKKAMTPSNILAALLLTITANSYLLVSTYRLFLPLLICVGMLIMGISLRILYRTRTPRWVFCHLGGNLLEIFSLSLLPSIVYHIILLIYLKNDWTVLFWSAVTCICVSAFVFWFGIICVYIASYQLGVKLRVLGILCGMIPILNLIILDKIIRTVMIEVEFEISREVKQKEQAERRICATQYPILFVHGVFFRDSKRFNYWGRIPKVLQNNGAQIYYGEHSSALSVPDSAAELSTRIRKIVEESGCEKVNIIAHSKGGLDCRYAIKNLGISPMVASLTTINTPHRGCLFADKMLGYIDQKTQDKIADFYNSALKRIGDPNPDFLAAVRDLTAEACAVFDRELTVPEEIYCQSFGSILNKATGGQFPLNVSYHLVRFFDGANDGLVGENSFSWGEHYELITTEGKRGISHGDMIDLNRENIPGFDVREFYVKLVSDLKDKGL
ncbi:MAG: triacylglycerol lipase [Ruminococcaceae bacterium]|nr:triacylglycerol lipase [Oscillospiraceae bacterium]